MTGPTCRSASSGDSVGRLSERWEECVRSHQHHHTGVVRAALARATRRTQPSPQTCHGERDRPRSSSLHEICTRQHRHVSTQLDCGSRAQDVFSASGSQQQHPRWKRSQRSSGGSSRSFGNDSNSGCGNSDSSKQQLRLGHTHHRRDSAATSSALKRRWSTLEQHGRPPSTNETRLCSQRSSGSGSCSSCGNGSSSSCGNSDSSYRV